MATTKVTTDVIDMSGNTGGLVWAKGATGDQPLPVDSTAGDLRENTTTGKTEVFNGTEWRNLKEGVSPITVDFLVVAGGGGGGNGGVSGSSSGGGGGGGAGGLRTSYPLPTGNSGGGISVEPALTLTSGTVYTITVGAAGAGAPSGFATTGSNGINSIISGSGITTITSTGGGGGGGGASTGIATAGNAGGSGGGAAADANIAVSAGAGTYAQGFAGGNYPGGNVRNAAGGGGASSVGVAGGTTAGDGGNGIIINIDGNSTSRAGGGGGGGGDASTGGTGTSGGGNGGDVSTGTLPTNAVDYTGGGGGGASNGQAGANGGSGIVILRCAKATATIGAGITVNGISAAGSVSGVAISGTSDYYYSATSGTGTITFS